MKPTLLVMAAGMGSRYGGLKQIDPVGPGGEAIIEYSMYDAIKAGFGKIVFVVREQFKDLFDEKIGSKVKGKIEVAYACQELEKCLGDYKLPPQREKPWGTAHAILVAGEIVNEPFAAINADDFYSRNSFTTMADFLSNPNLKAGEYSMVGFKLANTLSEHGSVSRGICQADEQNLLQKVVEHTKIVKDGSKIYNINDDETKKPMNADDIASMNFWGFGPDIFEHIKEQFAEFLNEKGKELKSEFYIPFVVDRLINEGKATVKVLPTESHWFGVTYKEDKEAVQQSIAKLIADGLYPEKLW
ncbi:MAG: NDP-sugar synthase [Sedimentisphaeraceae bacterium JB056]